MIHKRTLERARGGRPEADYATATGQQGPGETSVQAKTIRGNVLL